jgi:hypothetical protein
MRRLVIALALSTLAAGPAGCKDKASAPGARAGTPETYTVRGKVTSLPATAGGEIMIHHEKIPSFRAVDGKVRDMMSMEMPFALEPGAAPGGLAVGALIEIDLEVRWDAKTPLRIKAARPLPAGTTLDLK